jgi:hypothetical protein
MVMACFLSVVIDIINIVRAAVFKPENHPPVSPNCHSPKTFHLAFKRMQPKPRQVHMGDGGGGMKRHQNISQLAGVLRVQRTARDVLTRCLTNQLTSRALVTGEDARVVLFK